MVRCAYQPYPPAEDGDRGIDQSLAYVFAGGGNGQEPVAPVTAHSRQPASFQNRRTAQCMAAGGVNFLCFHGGCPGRGTTRRTTADPSKGCVCSLRSAYNANQTTGQGSLG